ncbi:MAG: bifunctional DNA-formamidopyrimidine glycosylase/DNA-(apurinic or apyrimidinic site) lyase [Luminiphilus sp.]|nr:bifunctional DNA-formamidopyrimidine glycosylase/DNA-(apurinic or apyrimidinic site) lyase [Luminiphilus sp.]
MPELPEVETTCRGIAPHIIGQAVSSVTVREARLRWPVPPKLNQILAGAQFCGVSRRAKYLLLETDRGTLMVHLGMSGSLRIMPADAPPLFHDHIDIVLADGRCLRYHDPRRFGSFHWLLQSSHPLLDNLGPEPLSDAFSGAYLYQLGRKRRASVKQFIMDGKVVVGVGNIYANEALFMAGIHPARAAGRIAQARYEKLVLSIKQVLADAIRQGGTTLRDFVGGDGSPGYFAQQLQVYGRHGLPCRVCHAPLREIRQGGRSTVLCPNCQR